MKVQRTHDKLYLKENYKDNPKEQYKFLEEEIRKENAFDANSRFSLLDIGCETGSFLYYIHQKYPLAELAGLDIMPELLAHVNDGLQGGTIQTFQADISDKNTLPKEKYDIVTMQGVLSIFDDYKTVLKNALGLVKDGKTLYVYGLFNPKDVNINIKVNLSDAPDGCWESGWNYISQKSIRNFCKEEGLKCDFFPFEIGIDIPEHEDDPLRSWTIKDENKKRLIVSGIQIIHYLFLCKISKS